MLVICDVDGTLVGASGVIPDDVLEATDTLRELGARIVLATGRPAEGVGGEMARRVDASAPHIFLNGALVRTGRGRVVERVELESNPLRTQIEAARRWGETLELYTAETHYVDELTDACRKHAELLELDPEECDLEEIVADASILKAQWIVHPSRVGDVQNLELSGCVVEQGVSPTMPDWRFVQVYSATAGKGEAGKQVASRLGEDLEEVVAVGDSANDRTLLEEAGYPFVMRNASEELRERFPTVGDVEDDGILEPLEFAARLLYRRK